MDVLIVVDAQNDFCEGGALPVAGGTKALQNTAVYIEYAQTIGWTAFDKIIFTMDWHNPLPDTNGGHFGDPPDFVDSWPVHCVADTFGAQIHPCLNEAVWKYLSTSHIVWKGEGKPDYSGFQAVEEPSGQSLEQLMKGVEHIEIAGLALDYCVAATAFDARKIFPRANITVLEDYTAAVDPSKVAELLDRFDKAGIYYA